MKGKKFLRSDTSRHLRLGKLRRNLRKWRRPKGRHSKIRKKRAGYPSQPGIGYGSDKAVSGLIKGKKPVLIHSIQELEQLPKDALVVLSRRLGAKKKLVIIKKASEKGLTLLNIKEHKQ